MERDVETSVKKGPDPEEAPKKDEWTSLSVRKSTRDRINSMSGERGMTPNDCLMFLADKAERMVPSQIVLNVSGVEYSVAAQMTEILHRNRLIDTPSVERMMRFALFHLKETMESEMEKSQRNAVQNTSTC